MKQGEAMSLQIDPVRLKDQHASLESVPMTTGEPPPDVAGRHRKRSRLSGFLGAVPSYVGVTVGLVLVVSCLQHFAPDGWRPSQLMGHFYGDVMASEIQASLAAEKARNAALQEELSRKEREVLAAQTQGQLLVQAAQSQAQQEVEAMKAKAQVAVAAYQTLFERSNQVAVLYAQTAQAFVQMRNDLARSNQGGGTMVATFADVFKGLAMVSGDDEMYAKADAIKRNVTEGQMRELDASMSRAMPHVDARAFIAQGLPDPAQMAAYLNFSPQVNRPAPIEVQERDPYPVAPYQAHALSP